MIYHFLYLDHEIQPPKLKQSKHVYLQNLDLTITPPLKDQHPRYPLFIVGRGKRNKPRDRSPPAFYALTQATTHTLRPKGVCASFQTRPDTEPYRKSAPMEKAEKCTQQIEENKSQLFVVSKFQASLRAWTLHFSFEFTVQHVYFNC